MAGLRGRGFSTGKALQILFRIVADGSQARREVNKTALDAGREIRAVETLLQRALSVLSRPIRSRLGLTGALGISLAREQLRGLAANEIQKVKKAYGEAGDEAEKTTKKIAKASTGASAAITSMSAALLAIRSVPAAQQIQEVSKDFADATFAIQTFEKVLIRTTQAAPAGKTFGPQVAFGEDLKALLGNLGVKPSRSTEGDLLGKLGISFRNKDAQEALAEFAKEFNAIPASIDRAALASRIFGADTAKMLPILEKVRTQLLNETAALQNFEAVSKNLAALEKAQREFAGLSITAAKKRTDALNAERVARVAQLKAEAAPKFQAVSTFAQIPRKDLPPFQKAETTIGSTLKIWNEYVKANIRVREEQKLATDSLFSFIEKAKAAKTATTEAKVVLESYAGSMGKIDVAETELHFAEQRVKNTKELIARNQELVQQFEKRKVTGLPDDQAQQAINRLTTKIAFQQQALVGYNEELTKANATLETFKDEMFLARKEAEALEKEQQLLEGSVLATRERLKKATIAVEEDPLEKTKRMRMENVAAAQKGADEARAKSTELGTIADEASTKALTKKNEVAERSKKVLSDVGFQTKLTAKETTLLSKALKDSTAKDAASVLNLLKQLNTVRTSGPGGPKKPISIPELDIKSLGNVEGFIKKYISFATAEERAGFATEILGKKLAGELTPALEGLATSLTKVTPEALAFSEVLGPIGIGLAITAGAALIFAGVMALIAKKTVETDAPIGRLAEKTGIMAENLSALDIAAQKADLGGIKAIQERIGSFDRIVGQAARGNLPAAAAVLDSIGISAEEAGKDVNAAFVKVVDAFNSSADPTRRAIISQTLFADRTGKLGLTLQEIGPSLDKFKAKVKESGRLLSTEGAKAALDFDRSLKLIEEQAVALGLRFGRQIVPGFIVGLKALSTEIYGVGNAVDIAGGIIKVHIEGLSTDLALFSAFMQTLSQGVKPEDIGFASMFQQNFQQIMKTAKEVKKTAQEVAAEQAQATEENIRLQKEQITEKQDVMKSAAADEKRTQEELTEHYQNQLKLRQISNETALVKEKEGMQKVAKTAITIKEQELKDERERNLDLAKGETEAQRVVNMRRIEGEIKQLRSDASKEEERINTEILVRRREMDDQAHEDAIAAVRAENQITIDLLKDKADKQIENRQDLLRQIAVIEKAITALELAEIERRIANAGQDPQLQAKLQAELVQKRIQIKADNKRREKADDEAGTEAALQRIRIRGVRLGTEEIANQGRISRLQEAASRRNVVVLHRLAEREAALALKDAQEAAAGITQAIDEFKAKGLDTTGLERNLSSAAEKVSDAAKKLFTAQKIEELPITLEQAEEEIIKIQAKGFKDRIRLMDDEIAIREKAGQDVRELIEQRRGIFEEEDNFTKEHATRIRRTLIQQNEDTRRILSTTNQILRDAAQVRNQANQEFVQKTLESSIASKQRRTWALREEVRLNHESENIQHAANVEQLKNDKEALKDADLTNEEYLAQEKAINAKLEAENQRHWEADNTITQTGLQKERQSKLDNNPFFQGVQSGQMFDLMGTMQKRLIETGEASINMGDMMNVGLGLAGSAVNGLAQGIGEMTQQWVLTGKTGPAVMKKLVATVLAGVAQQAVVQAIMFTAYGIASLTPWGSAIFGPAAPWFKAAALMGAIAVGSAALGRAVAGDSFAKESKEKSKKEIAADKEILHENEGRRQFVEHIHRVVVTGERGFVARQFAEEVKNNNQEVRRAINTAVK